MPRTMVTIAKRRHSYRDIVDRRHLKEGLVATWTVLKYIEPWLQVMLMQCFIRQFLLPKSGTVHAVWIAASAYKYP